MVSGIPTVVYKVLSLVFNIVAIGGLLQKYLTLFFSFCENLVDLNKARLHEAILDLHKHL